MKLLFRKLIIIWDELRFCWMLLFARNIRQNYENQSVRSVGLTVKALAHKMNLEHSDSPAPALAMILATDLMRLLAKEMGACYYRCSAKDLRIGLKSYGDWILIVKKINKKREKEKKNGHQ